MSVPDRVLTNADLEKMVDTSDEWIVTRTGIRERHVVGPDDSTTSLAVKASRQALDRAGLTAEDLDLIIVATCTADQSLVSEACLVQAELGGNAGAFDVGAACAGFVYALSTGSQFIQSGMYRRILVVGADTLTRFVDYSIDRPASFSVTEQVPSSSKLRPRHAACCQRPSVQKVVGTSTSTSPDGGHSFQNLPGSFPNPSVPQNERTRSFSLCGHRYG